MTITVYVARAMREAARDRSFNGSLGGLAEAAIRGLLAWIREEYPFHAAETQELIEYIEAEAGPAPPPAENPS